jgi:hypothetical protein
MNEAIHTLNQIEIAANDATAPVLRQLIKMSETVTGSTDDGDAAELGGILLLKLSHLLTQQHALRARARNGAPSYLAPLLVIQESAWA